MIKIKDVMVKNVIVSEPSVSLQRAAKIMDQYGIGCLIVVEKDKIEGIVSRSDMIRCMAKGCDIRQTKLSEIMTKDVVVIDYDKTVNDAVELMKEHNIKKIPVLKKGVLVGIITTSDIIVVAPALIESVSNLISFEQTKYQGG